MTSSNIILASDLDGTLIPTSAIDQGGPEQRSLEILSDLAADQVIELLFVTGRHFKSVKGAVDAYRLPKASWIICDVGSSIYSQSKDRFESLTDYQRHLECITGNNTPARCWSLFQDLRQIRLQESEKQTEHKLSFYCAGNELQSTVEAMRNLIAERSMPLGVVYSVDPFNGEGLIDVMPQGVNKAYALNWWANWQDRHHESILFAGDSGNDFEALTSDFRGILVGNAEGMLVDRLRQHHAAAETLHRIYFAKQRFAAGVWEGCLHHRPELKSLMDVAR